MPRPPVPRVRALLELLERHRVAHVVIGGVGARLWGSPLLTDDLDLCPASDRENLARLAAALNELEAEIRAPGLELGFAPPAPWDERSFGGYTSLTLTTKLGWLDLWFRPDGTGGYPDLIERAADVELAATQVKLASLDDIIRSKETAGRTKDLERLPGLRELRHQLQRRGQAGQST